MQLKLSWIRNLAVATLLVVLGGVLGYRLGTTGELPYGISIPFVGSSKTISALSKLSGSPTPTIDGKEISFDTFWEAWSWLERDYIDQEKLEPEKMVNGAIGGMVASLGDPYTMYLPPQDNKRSDEDLAGSFYGIGIELGYVENTLAIVSPLSGTPAEKAGLKAGDLIIHVKDASKELDEDTSGWTLDEAVDKLRGKRGSTVTLTIYRKEEKTEPFEVPVVRDEIIVKSVEVAFVEHAGKRVAHLKLSRFGERTAAEWDEAVRQILQQQGSVNGVVLDMRNNPGGFFDRSIEIASEFIDKGVIVTQKGKHTSENYPARGQARLKNLPVVVLVNRGSASASEIVAGALRDDKNAPLVGEKTFGKGTVQDRRELSNGGGIHITIGQWLLPKGEWIHEEGIPVTVEVKDNPDTTEDEVLLKGIEQLK